MSSLKLRDIFAGKLLAQLLAFFVSVCAVILSVRGFMAFPIEWDFLAYHLPFALRHYGLTTFQPNEFLMMLYDVFPPTAHYVQGALILLFQNPSAAALLNGLGFFCCLGLLKRMYPTIALSKMMLAILAMPVVLFQIGSGYIDLWVATWVWIAFIGAVKFVEDGCKSWKIASTIFAGLAISASSKYQAWPFCAVLLLFLFLGMVTQTSQRGDNRMGIGQRAAILGIAVLCTAAWPVRNFIKYGNPTYPLQPPIISKLVKFKGTEIGPEERKGQFPIYLRDASNPRMFLESALELNRLQESAESFKYSIDQGGYRGGAETPHHRMGGWTPYVVMGCLVFGLWRWLIELRHNRMTAASLPFGVVAVSAGILLFIPQNHELRYWTFLPLCMIFLLFKPLPSTEKAYSKALVAYFCGAFAITNINLIDIYRLRRGSAAQYYPAEARESVEQMLQAGINKDNEPACIGSHTPWDIYWAGANFNEVAVKVCKQ